MEDLNQVLDPFYSRLFCLTYIVMLIYIFLIVISVFTADKLERRETMSELTIKYLMRQEERWKRWNDQAESKFESPNITLLAAALDPRFKKLKFLCAASSVPGQRSSPEKEISVRMRIVKVNVLN